MQTLQKRLTLCSSCIMVSHVSVERIIFPVLFQNQICRPYLATCGKVQRYLIFFLIVFFIIIIIIIMTITGADHNYYYQYV